jgi:hypothetical protein
MLNLGLICLYPNPAKESVTIDLNKYTGITNRMSLFNAQGQKVSEVKTLGNEKTIQFPLENIPEGIYFVCLNSSEKEIYKKLIIAR